VRRRERTLIEPGDDTCRCHHSVFGAQSDDAHSCMHHHGRTVMRMIQRIQRAQQGAVSRTMMRVRALTHPGANLRQRTAEMDARQHCTAAEAPRRRMRMTRVRRCVAVTASNRAHSMVRARSSRFGHSSRIAHPTYPTYAGNWPPVTAEIPALRAFYYRAISRRIWYKSV